ncbi:MAG: PKD domain-containing protein, partial [Candidatus Riflebacteria bacterium]|nr:PKD domain-containing protein [Candidatus Riflebacteria bacterium]
LVYSWQQLSGPGLVLRPSAASPIVTFETPSTDAVIAMSLSVSNPRSGRATATTLVTVDGTLPTATLGFPEGSEATRHRSFTFQVDFSESIAATPAPTVTFHNSTGSGTLAGLALRPRPGDTNRTGFEAAFEASFSKTGIYTVLVEAFDVHGNPLLRQPLQNTLTVNVPNNPPVALALGPSQVTTGTTVTVDAGASSDPDQDPITYLWSGSDPLAQPVIFSHATSSRTSFVPLVPGLYAIRLIVTDVNGTSSAPHAIAVQALALGAGNRPPTASAGAGQLVAIGTPVTLRGSASDPDGDPLSFGWALVSAPARSSCTTGPLAVEQGGHSVEAFFVPDVPGAYSFLFTVTDRFGAQQQAAVVIVADDHANTPGSVTVADRLEPTSESRVATLEAAGDIDVFSFVASPGLVYRASLRGVTLEAAELTLLDSDGLAEISRATATPTTPAALSDYRPPTGGTRYLAVRGRSLQDQGTYLLELTSSADVFEHPPAFRLSVGSAAGGQVEASVSTDGTSVPLAFVQFLTDYDATALTLVGRSPDAAASGFLVDAQQFSLPFIDTLLSANPQPRPLPAGRLLTLNFRVAPDAQPSAEGARLLWVSATAPAPSGRVVAFRPTADAGLALTLSPIRGQDGVDRLPDYTEPARPQRPFLRLDGRLSCDPNIPALPLTYRWRLMEAPSASALPSDPTSPVPIVPLSGPGTYRYALTVSNGVLWSSTSTVRIQVTGATHPPSAEARLAWGSGRPGPVVASEGPVWVPVGERVSFDGSASTDEDAGDRGRLQYTWTQLAGPVRVSLPGQTIVSFPVVVEGTYLFQLAWMPMAHSLPPVASKEPASVHLSGHMG